MYNVSKESWSRTIALAITVVLLGLFQLRAEPILSLSEPDVAQDSPFVFGYSFQVGLEALSANALGYFYNGTSYQYAHPVGLWDSEGTLIASVTVPSGTPSNVVANFAYVSLLSPVFLEAGGTYTVGALNPVGSDYVPRQGNIVTIPEITIQSWLYAAATSLQEPDTSSGGFPVAAANIQVSSVPEPGTCGLLAMGILLAFRRRR